MKPTKEAYYKRHFKEMTGSRHIDDYSDNKIIRLFKRVLHFLPNDGKLYKYRKGEGQDFDYAYDSLENGYLWLADATTLNDTADCCLHIDEELNKNEIEEVISKHYIDSLLFVFERNKNLLFKSSFDLKTFKTALSFYDKSTLRIDKRKAICCFQSYGFALCGINEYLNEIDTIIRPFANDKQKLIDEIINAFNHFNNEARKMFKVLSLSESSSLKNMWSEYAGGCGFCIEYDFNKALRMDASVIRKLISIYKVTYSDERKPYSFAKDIENLIMKKGCGSNGRFVKELITKSTKWKDELEWRLLLCEIDNKLYSDLVNAIILDNAFASTINGKKILKLAAERNWTAIIRDS